MRRILCDKCGKEIVLETKSPRIKISGFPLFSDKDRSDIYVEYNLKTGIFMRPIDLCNECLDELLKYMMNQKD